MDVPPMMIMTIFDQNFFLLQKCYFGAKIPKKCKKWNFPEHVNIFLGPANPLFWSFLMIFALPMAPPDDPKSLDQLLSLHKTHFYHRIMFYIGLVHAWGHLILQISSSKKWVVLKLANTVTRLPTDWISQFQKHSLFRTWDLTFQMTPDMYQTNIKHDPMIELGLMKW